MSPATLKRALDPAYIGSPFAQPFQFFDGDVATPMDLMGRAVVLFLDRQGLPDAHHEITGVIQTDGRVLFSVADTSAWIKGDYSLEVRLDGASVVVGRIGVAKGAGANGSDMVGAAQPPTAPGVVIAGSGVVQVVSVAPRAVSDPSSVILTADLSAALGGAETLAAALLWLAQNGGTPSPIVRELIGGVVISSVATGALSVAAAGQVLLSGAISSVSSATGSLTVGAASSIALVGSAVSASSLTGTMTVVTQIALAGGIAGSSAVSGAVTVEATTYMPTTPVPDEARAMGRLWPEYTGPAATAYRLDTSASIPIPIGSDGFADLSGLSTFAGGATTTIDRWQDQAFVLSGGAVAAGDRDAVFSTSARRPLLREANKVRGRPAVSFGLTDAGGIGQAFLNRPAVAYSSQAVTVSVVGIIPGGAIDSYGLGAIGVSTTYAQALSILYDGVSALHVGARFGVNGPPTGQPIVVTMVASPTETALYINGVLQSSTAAFALLALTGGYVGRGALTTATNGVFDCVQDITWSVALTSTQVMQWAAAALNKWGVQSSWTKLLYCNGDSLTASNNESGFGTNHIRMMLERWTGELPKTPNFGKAGDPIGVETAGSQTGRILNDTNNDPLGKALASQAFAKKAGLFNSGTNDIESSVSFEALKSRFQYWIAANMERLDGNLAYKNVIPRGWTASGNGVPAKEAVRLAFNDWSREQAPIMGFQLCDVGAIPQLTTGLTNGAGNPNPPAAGYYGAGSAVHPNNAGETLICDVVHPVCQALLA